jgi:hypothetical protein
MRQKSGYLNRHQRRSDRSTGILARFNFWLDGPLDVFQQVPKDESEVGPSSEFSGRDTSGNELAFYQFGESY